MISLKGGKRATSPTCVRSSKDGVSGDGQCMYASYLSTSECRRA